jgi:hypothetical protein
MRGPSAKYGFIMDLFQGLRAKPAGRHVADTPEGLIGLKGIRAPGEAQESQGVLDLGTLIEAHISYENIRRSAVHQRLLDPAGHALWAHKPL